MTQPPLSKLGSEELTNEAAFADSGGWFRQRMRRTRQPSTPPAIQPEAASGDVFCAGQRRTVSTPLEANFMNGGMPLLLAMSYADGSLQKNPSPRASPSIQRRASISGTPSPLRQPLIARRASVQIGRGSPVKNEAVPQMTSHRPGMYPHSGLVYVAGRALS